MKMKRIANNVALQTIGYVISGFTNVYIYVRECGYQKRDIYRGLYKHFAHDEMNKYAYIAFVRNRDKDKESNVKHDATVLTEIGYIKANTDEIKAEQKEQRKTNTEFVTRLTDVEASAKQAHKRLDHIEKRMDQAE